MKAKIALGACHAIAPHKILLMLFVTATIFFSCKKESAATGAPAQPVNNIDNITKLLNGSALTGSIVTDSDENNMVLTFNSGTKYVIIEKIPGMPVENVNAIRSAVLITSKYGVIVKDTDNNKVWLLANNDEESLQKFEAIKQQLHCSFVCTTVFGVTIVNS